MNIPKAVMVADVDPGLATVVFGFLHYKFLSFYFQWKEKSKSLKAFGQDWWIL